MPVAREIVVFPPLRLTAIAFPGSRSRGPSSSLSGDAPEFPPVVFCTGPHVPVIKFHPETGGFKVCFEFFCGGYYILVTFPDGDRYDHDLESGDSREDQAFVISVNGDQCRDTALRYPVAGLVRNFLFPVFVLVQDRRTCGRSGRRDGGRCRSGGFYRSA